MSPVLLIIAVIIFAYLFYDFATSRPTRIAPPGPIRLPIVGSYWHFLISNYTFPFKYITRLTEKFKSPIVSFYLGDFYIVAVTTYETCKEVFNNPELQGRPYTFFMKTRGYGKRLGIFFDDGHDWLIQRRFTLRQLRDFGYGRRSDNFERVVEDEVSLLLEAIQREQDKGHGVLVPEVFYVPMLNSMIHLLTGSKFPKCQEDKLKLFSKKSVKFLRSGDALGGSLSFFPWVRYFIPNESGYLGLLDGNKAMQDLGQQLIDDIKKSFDEEAIRGFVDLYVKYQKEYPKFTDDQLRMVCVDLLFASATATTITITIALVQLILNPHVQDKCQEEIDAVVGRGRLPTLHDRQNLPYVESLLREALRYEAAAPLAVPHLATENTTLCGYEIPKNTVVFTNIYQMQRDKNLWGDPLNFRPERFLDYKGQLKKKDYSLPFGLGKRVCAGETFSRQNMFLILAGVLQNFRVEKKDEFVYDDLLRPGLLTNIKDDFRINFIERK